MSEYTQIGLPEGSPLPLVTLPDPRLHQKSADVQEVNDEIKQAAANMIATMYNDHGVGLAAVQVGIMKRILVLDVDHQRDEAGNITNKKPQVFINAKVVWSSEETSDYDEGCLSIPGVSALVTRPAQVKVQYMDLDGQQQEIEADGLLATCLQHEIDHNNGITFIDHLSALKKDRIMKKYNKIQKHNM
jgi:peptide deformylase